MTVSVTVYVTAYVTAYIAAYVTAYVAAYVTAYVAAYVTVFVTVYVTPLSEGDKVLCVVYSARCKLCLLLLCAFYSFITTTLYKTYTR